jgi:hypothetical protein
MREGVGVFHDHLKLQAVSPMGQGFAVLPGIRGSRILQGKGLRILVLDKGCFF